MSDRPPSSRQPIERGKDASPRPCKCLARSAGSPKRALAVLSQYTGLASVASAVAHIALPRHIRAVNYHSTPEAHADGLRAQLLLLAKHYVPCGMPELEAALAGAWPHRRPGLIVTFDDGLRNNAEVAAPILEEHGFPGWFCIPTGFVDCPPEDQPAFAAEHNVTQPGGAMTWDQVRELANRHIIVAHGHKHRRLSADLTPAELEEEILHSRRRIAEELGSSPPEVFCWIGGEEWAYSRRAADLIREAGYRYAFMTNNCPITHPTDPHQLQRTHLESDWPLGLVCFQVSGLMDLLYTGKRRRVNRLTAPRSLG